MNNPLAIGRQFLYDRVAASSTFMALVSNKWFNRRPAQAVTGAFGFLSHASTRLQTPLGTEKQDGSSLWDINLVIGRDEKLSVLESMVNEVSAAIHVKLGSTAKGQVGGCTVVGLFELPYDIGSDEYPRQIVRARVETNN